MIEQYVQANSLSCLLNRDSFVEVIPEPFRMQGMVSFRVTYSEYINYILSLPVDSGIILSNEFTYLRNLASSANPKLYAYFLQDMAFAICKELVFAEKYRQDASVILPASFNGNNVMASAYLESYRYCVEVEKELLNKVSTAGFGQLKVQRDHNRSLFKLAVILYFMSKVPTVMEEVNLVYDLA